MLPIPATHRWYKKMLRFILKVSNTSFKKETKGLLTQTPVRHTPCLRCIWMETSTMADWEVTSNAAVDCVSLAPYVNAAVSQSWSLPSMNLTVIWSLCHTVKGSSWPRELLVRHLNLFVLLNIRISFHYKLCICILNSVHLWERLFEKQFIS